MGNDKIPCVTYCLSLLKHMKNHRRLNWLGKARRGCDQNGRSFRSLFIKWKQKKRPLRSKEPITHYVQTLERRAVTRLAQHLTLRATLHVLETFFLFFVEWSNLFGIFKVPLKIKFKDLFKLNNKLKNYWRI